MATGQRADTITVRAGAPAEVLVLEDDPVQLKALEAAISATGLVPLLTEHPRKALAMLSVRRPVLAVIDLDMSRAQQTGRTVREVLQDLYEYHGVCIPIVYSARVDSVEQRDWIAGLHPYAHVQDKRAGEAALVRLMRRLLRASFGDLTVESGRVRHLPSGRVFTHRVGVALLVAKNARLDVVLDDTEARAVRRFNAWLRDEVASVVRVKPYRNRHYDVELIDDARLAPPGSRSRADWVGANSAAEVLILEDDPDHLQMVEGIVSRLHLAPLPTRDARTALRLLGRRRPVLAIIDLDMSKAAPTPETAADVLVQLYEYHGGCIPLVHSANVSTIEQRDRVAALHAHALVQDKKDGEGGLRERISKLVNARYGDLHVDGGRVCHTPTGRSFPHRVAVALVVAARAEKSEVVLDASEGRAARRLDAWLRDEVRSGVRVRHDRTRYYLVKAVEETARAS